MSNPTSSPPPQPPAEARAQATAPHDATVAGEHPQGHGSDHGDEYFDPRPHRPGPLGVGLVLLAAAGAVAGAVTLGVLPRMRARERLQSDHARVEGAVPRVTVVRPARPSGAGGLTLPGTIEPVQDSEVYARTTGYVRRYEADLGDAVHEGQVLATIDTPETTQELRQARSAVLEARARVQQVRAQLELARTRSTRYAALAPTGVVSRQEADDYRGQTDVQGASVQAAQASVASAEANVRRLEEVERFSVVRAPFDGVITSRSVEIGQLVTAGTGSGRALFRVSKMDVVRAYVSVPQSYAPNVRVGTEATVHLREFPGRAFTGTVARTARALDATTRTMLTEVRITNADGALLSGMYAQLTLPIERAASLLTVPATALNAGADGTRIAVVEQGTLRWRRVQVDADLGDRVALSEGLREGDVVVATPSERLTEGQRVETVDAPRPSAGPGAPAGGGSAPSAGAHR